jgi:putative transposase
MRRRRWPGVASVQHARCKRQPLLCLEGQDSQPTPAGGSNLPGAYPRHFACSNETYGGPRIHADLKAQGLAIGRRRVARLMRDNGLRALQRRRLKRTTDSQHNNPVVPNLLEQDFTATGPNQKWGSDILYIWIAEGWLYLAVVVDLYSRRIIGWAVSG